MYGLREQLQEHRDAIVERWCQDALTAYADTAATAFVRERDRFANPVGHSIRAGTSEIFDALLEGADDAVIRGALDSILSIRAVQQLRVDQAIGFLFHLKDLIRAELNGAADEHALVELERRIDRAALAAFETYVAYRELVCELRINEVKRTIPWAVTRGRR
jgi:RsbT co-antagonist protein rsbRD N-terminal domain